MILLGLAATISFFFNYQGSYQIISEQKICSKHYRILLHIVTKGKKYDIVIATNAIQIGRAGGGSKNDTLPVFPLQFLQTHEAAQKRSDF